MRKFLFLLIALLSISCSHHLEDFTDALQVEEQEQTTKNINHLSLEQATCFSSLIQSAGLPCMSEEASTRSVNSPVEIENFDFSISSEGDTLMYCINYKDNRGFVIVSADVSTFPLLAHSEEGHFSFDVSEDNPLKLWIEAQNEMIQNKLKNDTLTIEDNWLFLADTNYTYEIEKSSPEITASLCRRRNSTGKATIYPHTGIKLKWHQETGYNYNSPIKGQLVGCPAVAIGMLMFDLYWRPTYFGPYPTQYNLLYAATEYTEDKENIVSKMFRDISNTIPGYRWGFDQSGANRDDITIGLHRLGFPNAVAKNYNFEEAYLNLQKHGILLAGVKRYDGGHIWFCDGYYEQGYTVKRKFLGIKVKSWNEYEDRLYMNWGWDEAKSTHPNGWYEATNFFEYSIGKTMYVNLDYSPNKK